MVAVGKKGAYFFVIDAVFAGIIIVTALFFLFSATSTRPERENTFRASEDFANFLYSTKIREYNSVFVWSLVNDSTITNLDSNLIDEMVRFYYTGQQVVLANFTADVASTIISSDRGLLIFLNGTLIYNSSGHKDPATMNASRLMLSSKRMGFTMVNQSLIYGPTWLEVKVWV